MTESETTFKKGELDKSKVTFQLEMIGDVWDEFMHLAEQHWEETEQYYDEPLDVNKEAYLNYSKIGYHRLYTIRYDGKYIGHAGMYVTLKTMHCNIGKAAEDVWFVEKPYRGMFFKDFYNWVEADLKSLGVSLISITTKVTNGTGTIALAFGFEHIANEYMKRI